MYDGEGSRFVRHGPCEACGSRDNVAWYANGSGFCFGCGKFYRGTLECFARSVQGSYVLSTQPVQLRSVPDDVNCEYPLKVLAWIKQYDLDVTDLIRNNVKWSPSHEQLIYLFYGEDAESGQDDAKREVVLWQARNFREGTTHQHRFFTGGTPEDVIAVYPPGQTEGTIGVIVEDCISALKVGKSGFVGVPCFSSAVSHRKLSRLAKRFDKLIFWLDGDKYKEAQKQERRAQLLGVSTGLIYTELDPKEYPIPAIRRYVLKDERS